MKLTAKESRTESGDAQSYQRYRKGVATLEFALCLPILLAIVVGVIWLGTSVIAQTEVTIEARHKAWSKRDASAGTALLFLRDDIASDQASKTVEVSPVFDDGESPESKHDVMQAAWDHRQMPLKSAPSWKEFAKAAANAKTGGLQVGYVDATNKFTRFKSDAGNVWENLGAKLIEELTGLGDQAKSLLKNGEDAGESKKQQARQKIRSELDARRQELREAKQKLRELDAEASETLKKVLKNRVKRLEAVIDDLKADLRAID